MYYLIYEISTNIPYKVVMSEKEAEECFIILDENIDGKRYRPYDYKRISAPVEVKSYNQQIYEKQLRDHKLIEAARRILLNKKVAPK